MYSSKSITHRRKRFAVTNGQEHTFFVTLCMEFSSYQSKDWYFEGTMKNPGNFLALLKPFAEHDSVLHANVHQPKARNASYLSPSSQKDIISDIGNNLIQAKLITEIKEAT